MTSLRPAPAILALLFAVLPALAGQVTEMGPRRGRPVATVEDPSQARVIVRYRSGSPLMQSPLVRGGSARVLPQHAAAFGQRLGYALRDGRVLGERTQAMRGEGLASSALAGKLRQQADVEWAVVDERRTIMAAPPNDPLYGPNQTSTTPAVGQWYLRAPDATAVAAINAPAAWDITKGSAGVTVAVLDTGVRFEHPDLAGKLYPGYDFVSSQGGDGDGRDADASDPGDYTAANECSRSSSATNSSWHGTQTAGIVGAATDNSIGMASVGRDVMVLPVRVIGKCGGFDSDIIAAMYWAAGLSSTPVPNPHPARVLSMSLGGSGTCAASYKQAFSDMEAAGVSVVVAAGNDEGLTVSQPANCAGAIAVAAVRHVGTKVGFSSLGPEVTISAPGGNCVNSGGQCLYALTSTTNSGATTPTTSSYLDAFNYEVGTSYSTPMVAGAIGLMLSVNPGLTPAAIRSALRASARPFPTTGALTSNAAACRAPTAAVQDECYCTTATCGAGMLDVGAAVAAVVPPASAPPQAVIAVSSATPTVGDSVALSAAGSTVGLGRSVAGYQWQITTGGSLATFSGAANGSTATLVTSGAGAVTVTLVVTDSTGATGTSSSVINVQAAVVTPVTGGGGGGGAFSVIWIALLALAVFTLRRARRG